MKSTFNSLLFLFVLHLCQAGPLRLQKRAASFYIANDTACVVDSTVYLSGDPIPTDDPCEACRCRPPGFACVLKECQSKPGCRAVRRAGHCCPDYICGCEHNGRMYRDGDEIRDSQNPCYTCHCQGSSIACAFVDCFFRVDCAPDYVKGECCPRYDHCSTTTTTADFDNATTTSSVATENSYRHGITTTPVPLSETPSTGAPSHDGTDRTKEPPTEEHPASETTGSPPLYAENATPEVTDVGTTVAEESFSKSSEEDSSNTTATEVHKTEFEILNDDKAATIELQTETSAEESSPGVSKGSNDEYFPTTEQTTREESSDVPTPTEPDEKENDIVKKFRSLSGNDADESEGSKEQLDGEKIEKVDITHIDEKDDDLGKVTDGEEEDFTVTRRKSTTKSHVLYYNDDAEVTGSIEDVSRDTTSTSISPLPTRLESSTDAASKDQLVFKALVEIMEESTTEKYDGEVNTTESSISTETTDDPSKKQDTPEQKDKTESSMAPTTATQPPVQTSPKTVAEPSKE